MSDNAGNSASVSFNITVDNNLQAYPQGNDPDDYPSCSMSVSPKANVSLQVAVEADDTSKLTCQWYEDYEEITGENGAEFNVPSITADHYYYCVVNH